MLELQNVTKTFGKQVTAVDDLSLRLDAGVVGLIGHNGAGKTTLMQMIATLARPTSGRILWDGTDILAKPDAIRRRLGYLPQDFGVYRNVSALEFMQYFAALKGVRDPARIRRLLVQVDQFEQANRMASTFSGGMLRRLGIAQRRPARDHPGGKVRRREAAAGGGDVADEDDDDASDASAGDVASDISS